MAPPTFSGGSGLLEAITKGHMFSLRHAGIHADRHIGHRAPQQMRADPFAALHRMIFKVAAPCRQPSRMREYAGAFALRKFQWLLRQVPAPVGRQVEGGLIRPPFVVALHQLHALVFN